MPTKWTRSEEEMVEIEQEMKQKQQAEQMMNVMGQGAAVAEQVGKAGTALKEMAS
jgi:hypothetical protein